MFTNRKTQYSQDISSSLLDTLSQCDPNRNTSGLFCGYRKTDATVYVEWQKTQRQQDDAEGEELGWRADTTWLQDFLQSYSNHDGVALGKDRQQITRTEQRA